VSINLGARPVIEATNLGYEVIVASDAVVGPLATRRVLARSFPGGDARAGGAVNPGLSFLETIGDYVTSMPGED